MGIKRLPVQLALVIVGLGLLGAFLHPLTLLLSLLPWDATGVVNAMRLAREGIADLLGWGVVAAVATMAGYVAWERSFSRHPRIHIEHLLDTDPIQNSPPKVVVAITAYNDAQATATAVRGFIRQPGVIRVLVIDNNSSDNTADLARTAGATVIQEAQQGYGHTCIRGLVEALKVPEADVIVLTEGDGTFVADDVAKFLAYVDHADLIVGNRTVRDLVARDSQMDSFFTWGNMAVAFLLRLRFWDSRFLGPAGLSDVGCTFRAIRRDALRRIVSDLSVGGMHFSPHMLLVALSHGLSVVEVPIRFRRRVGESKGASRNLWTGLQVGLAMMGHIVTYRPKTTGSRRALFVERDDVVGSMQSVPLPRLEFVPHATEALAALSRNGHSVVVIATPSDIDAPWSRGLSRAIENQIAVQVECRRGRISAFATAPSRRDASGARPVLQEFLLKTARRLSIDGDLATVISSKPQTLAAAKALGWSAIYLGSDHRDEGSNSLTEHLRDFESLSRALLVHSRNEGNVTDQLNGAPVPTSTS